jgi:hypothetical protein
MAEHREPPGSMRTIGDLHIDLEGYQVIAGGTPIEASTPDSAG